MSGNNHLVEGLLVGGFVISGTVLTCAYILMHQDPFFDSNSQNGTSLDKIPSDRFSSFLPEGYEPSQGLLEVYQRVATLFNSQVANYLPLIPADPERGDVSYQSLLEASRNYSSLTMEPITTAMIAFGKHTINDILYTINQGELLPSLKEIPDNHQLMITVHNETDHGVPTVIIAKPIDYMKLQGAIELLNELGLRFDQDEVNAGISGMIAPIFPGGDYMGKHIPGTYRTISFEFVNAGGYDTLFVRVRGIDDNGSEYDIVRMFSLEFVDGKIVRFYEDHNAN